MIRSKFFLMLLTISAVILFLLNTTHGEDGSAQKGTHVFTNQDIEKYKKPSDIESVPVKTDRADEKKEKLQKAKEEREKEYWCKNAMYYKKRMEKVQDEVKDAENELKKADAKKKKIAEKKLKKSKKNLKYAEKDLGELEDEAHRKGIPPGWLRCQFE